MENKETYILALDEGTSSAKACIFDKNGILIGQGHDTFHQFYPKPGWVEQDPNELWQAVAATSLMVIQKSGIDPAELLGVGVSAQMWNTLPINEKGRPLTPMLSWLDLRSIRQAERITSGETPAFLFKHTGNIPTAKDSIPKILWLKEERPEVWDRTAYLLDCKEYILFKLIHFAYIINV